MKEKRKIETIRRENSLWSYTEKQVHNLHYTWDDVDYVMMKDENGKLVKSTLDDFAQLANNTKNSDPNTYEDRDGIVIVFKDDVWMRRAVDRHTYKVEWWEVINDRKYGEYKSSIEGAPPGWQEEVRKRDRYYYFLPLAGTGCAGINRIQTDEEMGRK